MENLMIKAQKDDFFTPNVLLDADQGQGDITGESYLEYTTEFYSQISDWVKQYFLEKDDQLIFNFKLTYFNTSSFKAILSLLRLLRSYQNKKNLIKVNWYYPMDDYDMLKEAEDLVDASELETMELIPYDLDEN